MCACAGATIAELNIDKGCLFCHGGLFLCHSLQGVTFEQQHHEVDDAFRAMYDTAVQLWQDVYKVLKNNNGAFPKVGCECHTWEWDGRLSLASACV